MVRRRRLRPKRAPAEEVADNLAWLFYKDGVRELTLARGFEEAELVKLLEIVQRARNAPPDEDDLVTMLWEADFAYLKYKYVDLLHDGSAAASSADGDESRPASPDIEIATRGAPAAAGDRASRGFVNMADFDSTLYFLDEPEIEYLHGEIEREYEQDLRANVVAVLLDIFEAQTDPAVRSEVIENLHTLMVYLLVGAHFRGVAFALRESRSSLDRAQDLAARAAAAARRAAGCASARPTRSRSCCRRSTTRRNFRRRRISRRSSTSCSRRRSRPCSSG